MSPDLSPVTLYWRVTIVLLFFLFPYTNFSQCISVIIHWNSSYNQTFPQIWDHHQHWHIGGFSCLHDPSCLAHRAVILILNVIFYLKFEFLSYIWISYIRFEQNLCHGAVIGLAPTPIFSWIVTSGLSGNSRSRKLWVDFLLRYS